jgi:acetylornithine deacetylase/succinyl-diaminopimelate desuccinylase-like protein
MKEELCRFIKENDAEMRRMLRELCVIPAPSYAEDARAAYCKEWLEQNGATGVVVDEAKNVLLPLCCEGSNEITVVVSHTDTVFPDTEPMPYREENGRAYCPGVGDDTASLVVMLMTAKYFLQKGLCPKGGLLFVCNSCEEGLGNLYGTRTFMAAYAGRVKQFISYDSPRFETVNDECVGSHRYEVELTTEGGHSYLAFGKRSAVLSLAEMIGAIYAIDIPQQKGSKTTLNVGTIEGGTSVNTIPQSAKMLCEYRSNNKECMAFMKAEFERIFRQAECEHTHVTVKMVGDRPCAGDVDPVAQAALTDTCRAILEEVAGVQVHFTPSSTDCNIPLSMGIPSLCISVYRGAGMHTREEYVELDSLSTGLEISIKTMCQLTEVAQ